MTKRPAKESPKIRRAAPAADARRTAIGQRLRALRDERGLSQIEAAEGMGFSRPYLAGLEGGSARPGRNMLVAVAEFYGVTTDFILTGSPPRGPRVREVVEDPDELALLKFWRTLDLEDRRAMTRLLAIPAMASVVG
jgi:transcriptional regulator with XRE-family HTH domain